ncbi:PREDICTED: protein FAM189A2-like, partial [Cariama cristata]|uniref:protein FAM189A2-like n=1 Tax=Cariama cristata TaxID=54380 RepID=UPI000520BF54
GNLSILLSVMCVLLSLAGFILGCQGARFVSSVFRCDLVGMGESKTCFCCEQFHVATCREEESALMLYHTKSCSAALLLLKKILFTLSALNVLTATVCLVVASLDYLQIFAARTSCTVPLCNRYEALELEDQASDNEDEGPSRELPGA